MSANLGVVLLWLIPALAAALIAWTRGRRLDRLRAQHARADDEAVARHEAALQGMAWRYDQLHRISERDYLALERDYVKAKQDRDEWRELACGNYRLYIDAKYAPAVSIPVPSDLDRARERRDAKGRFVAKAVAE